jgi:hypothetical protein
MEILMDFKTVIATLLLAIVSSVVQAQTTTKNQEYEKQISMLIQKGNCEAAESVAGKAESQDKYLSYLPEWYYQIIACHKKKHEGWGALDLKIYEFINRSLDRFINDQSCNEAEMYINKIDKKFFTSWPFSPGLYKVAHCYEKNETKKSALLYRRIISDYPKDDYATGAKQRLQYLTGDRSWIFPTATSVIDGVKEGILHKDVNRLGKYASKSNFEISLEEEWMPELFDDKGEAILKSAFDRSAPNIVYVNSVPHRSMMLVVFSAEDSPFWCFTFDEKEGGWQWTGILIASWQKKFISSNDYLSYKEKVCAPSTK